MTLWRETAYEGRSSALSAVCQQQSTSTQQCSIQRKCLKEFDFGLTLHEHDKLSCCWVALSSSVWKCKCCCWHSFGLDDTAFISSRLLNPNFGFSSTLYQAEYYHCHVNLNLRVYEEILMFCWCDTLVGFLTQLNRYKRSTLYIRLIWCEIAFTQTVTYRNYK